MLYLCFIDLDLSVICFGSKDQVLHDGDLSVSKVMLQLNENGELQMRAHMQPLRPDSSPWEVIKFQEFVTPLSV